MGLGLFLQWKSPLFQQKVRGCQGLLVALGARHIPTSCTGDRHNCDNSSKSFQSQHDRERSQSRAKAVV